MAESSSANLKGVLVPNGFMWFEVNAREDDIAAVTDFYRAVFDGPIGPDETDGPYRAWMMNGEQPWAAVVEADDVTTGRWVPYVHVEDLEVAVAGAVGAGGTVVIPKTAGPAGNAVTIADPAGALIALWVPFESAD